MDAMLAKYRDIFDKKTFCCVATVRKDGTPQVTPVWCEFDGTHIVFNTARGRVKDANLSRNPKVTLAAGDPHIDKMAKKYIGQDRYPWRRPGEQRLLVKILPERVQGMG